MFNLMKLFKKVGKKEEKESINNSRDAAKERLHLVLMQDRANVSADFLELMKQEIIEVIKKYIDIDESAIDVKLTNQENEDGTNGAPALYANIPIVNIKNEARKVEHKKEENKAEAKTENTEEIKEESQKENEEQNKNETEVKEEIKEVEEAKEVKAEEEPIEEKTEENEEEKNIVNERLAKIINSEEEIKKQEKTKSKNENKGKTENQ